MSVDPSLPSADLAATDRVLQALVSGSGYVFKLTADMLAARWSDEQVADELFLQLRAQTEDKDPNLVDIAAMTHQLTLLDAARLSLTERKDDNAFFTECATTWMKNSPDPETREACAVLVAELEKSNIPLGVLWAKFLLSKPDETWLADHDALKGTHEAITGLIEQYRVTREKKNQ